MSESYGGDSRHDHGGEDENKCACIPNTYIDLGAFIQSSKLKIIEGGSETKSISIADRHLNNYGGVVEIAGMDGMENLESLYFAL